MPKGVVAGAFGPCVGLGGKPGLVWLVSTRCSRSLNRRSSSLSRRSSRSSRPATFIGEGSGTGYPFLPQCGNAAVSTARPTAGGGGTGGSGARAGGGGCVASATRGARSRLGGASGDGVRRFDPPSTSRSLSSFRSTALSRSLSAGRSGAVCASTPTLVETTARVTRPRTANFNFASSMAFSTPSVRVATEVETTPARDEPAATSVATRIVESTSKGGNITAWESWLRTEASVAADKAMPRRVRRSRSRAFARASRLDRVPSETLSRAAASRRESPSSSQSTMAARCRSGRRANSSSRIMRSSLVMVWSGGSTGNIAPNRFSLAFWRVARARASEPRRRRATPCSQLANCSRRAIAAALPAPAPEKWPEMHPQPRLGFPAPAGRHPGPSLHAAQPRPQRPPPRLHHG